MTHPHQFRHMSYDEVGCNNVFKLSHTNFTRGHPKQLKVFKRLLQNVNFDPYLNYDRIL